MNVRLNKGFVWQSGVVYDREFHINRYFCSVDFHAIDADREQTNLAYERMRYWIENVMDESVMISYNSDLHSAYQMTGQRIISLPDEPVDQLVGIMLFCKLSSITQQRVIISEISISSTLGDEVIYMHAYNENTGPFHQPGWWNDPSPIWYNKKDHRAKDKVVNLNRAADWSDLDLDWKNSDQKINNQVVFADFSKDEEK
jgi:hypothetical protein